MALKGWGQQNDIAIGESIAEVKFIIASEDDVEVETFDCGVAEGPDEASVGSMADFTAQLFVLIQDFGPDSGDVTHL